MTETGYLTDTMALVSLLSRHGKHMPCRTRRLLSRKPVFLASVDPCIVSFVPVAQRRSFLEVVHRCGACARLAVSTMSFLSCLSLLCPVCCVKSRTP